ncbi:hypothetical protein [Micromonospora sp. NPDC047730]|uniref:hypothetical protein n=1 Tax=Micromonospora sp. NPDC047730 TaxID=3364253 RepID=UPI00371444CF
MSAVETIPAAAVHEDAARHRGRQISTPYGWRIIRDIRRAPDPDSAVIVEVASDVDSYEALIFWPERLVLLRDDALETGNCFGVYTRGQVVETHRLREHAHLSLVDREPGFATVVVICPVHPHYLAEECSECGPEHLEAVLAAEDYSDDDLLDEERRTCHHCRAWAPDEHLDTARHKAFVARAFNLSALPRSA